MHLVLGAKAYGSTGICDLIEAQSAVPQHPREGRPQREFVLLENALLAAQPDPALLQKVEALPS